MLSIAVKNSLLVILIILILHFMLKNHLLEQNAIISKTLTLEGTSKIRPTTPRKEEGIESLQLTADPAKAKYNKEEELYKFVFETDAKQCDPPSHEPPVVDKGTLQKPKPISKQALNQTNLVVNEYENESALNGGNLFGALSGYDGMESAYVEW